MKTTKHTYQPPQGSKVLRYLLPFVGSLIFTFLVFYVIPLMKRLEGGEHKIIETHDEGPPLTPPETFVKDDKPPPPIEQDEVKELPPEMSDLDIPIDIPNLGGGAGGGGFLNVNPGFAMVGNGSDFANDDLNEPPRVVSRARPQYPPSLMKKQITGRVIVSALISETGSVESVSTKETSGYPAMDRAAEKAVRRWRFKPGIQKGKKVRSTVLVPINFKLTK